MKKILGNVFGHSPDVATRKLSKDIANHSFIGIEIEVENAKAMLKLLPNYWWKQVAEHSVRNDGIEIVTAPIKGEDIFSALDSFEVMHKLSPKLQTSARTGVHIHIDFRDNTLEELKRFVSLYTIFEKVLFSVCGAGRENNPYCVPISSGNYVHSALLALNSDSELINFMIYINKYYALNLRPLATQGSIEFRAMEGTLDTKRILELINMLLSIKTYAEKSEEGTKQLVDNVCIDTRAYYYEVLGQSCPEFTAIQGANMLENSRHLQHANNSKSTKGPRPPKPRRYFASPENPVFIGEGAS